MDSDGLDLIGGFGVVDGLELIGSMELCVEGKYGRGKVASQAWPELLRVPLHFPHVYLVSNWILVSTKHDR